MSQIRSSAKFVRISSSKLRPTANLVRGLTLRKAAAALEYMPTRGAKLIRKCLASLAANAEDRGVRNVDNLVLDVIEIGGGPIMRRIQPMSRGQAFVIRKRLSHIFLAVNAPEL